MMYDTNMQNLNLIFLYYRLQFFFADLSIVNRAHFNTLKLVRFSHFYVA